MKLDVLRQKHPVFTYQKYERSLSGRDLHLQFFFRLEPDYNFCTELIYHEIDIERYLSLDPQTLDNFTFHIGMVEALSYWKTACSPLFKVQAGYLDETQLTFWKQLLLKGLSEFFFVNHIDAWQQSFVQFVVEHSPTVPKLDTSPHQETTIIPVGGGKDSVVTIELLKKTSEKLATFVINPSDRMEQILRAAYIPQTIRVSRMLDPQLKKLNAEGYLNGHTPFSAMVSFVTVFAAYLFDLQQIAVSNEWSANEGNVIFLGQTINHQYSKTVEYERAFREYCRTYLSSSIGYFSFLRPWHELQITREFAKHPQYFPLFLSCNRGQKRGVWCGECAKCVFVYCMLSAFLEPQIVEGIFGQNLFAKKELRTILDELSGVVETKSFECVGTRDETRLALLAAIKKYGSRPLPELLAYAHDHILDERETNQQAFDELLRSFQTEHFIPTSLLPLLLDGRLIHDLRREYHDKRLLILGFGREGQSTYRLLKTCFPEKSIGVADEHVQSFPEYDGYLEHLDRYDVIFKTPGIPQSLPELQRFVHSGGVLTSQLNEFLHSYSTQTIGVTGTKGKSTTSALLAHLLQAAHKHVLLLGNIGQPVFDAAAEMTPDTIAVVEMSSYQLENVRFSPTIAVMLSLYPEHINYHGTYKQYVAAKQNITKFQTARDLLIYNADVPELITTAHQTHAQTQPFSTRETLAIGASLPAIIREKNLPAALCVAHHFGLTDDVIVRALETFQPLAHRLQVVGTYRSVTFIDDTLATIPQATTAALETLPRIDVLLLGGFDRGIDFAPIVDAVIEHRIPTVLFFPDTGVKMLHLMQEKYSNQMPTTAMVTTMQEAVELSYRYAPKNGVVLLSPASPSFSGFKNYEDKSAQFVYWIKKLSEE